MFLVPSGHGETTPLSRVDPTRGKAFLFNCGAWRARANTREIHFPHRVDKAHAIRDEPPAVWSGCVRIRCNLRRQRDVDKIAIAIVTGINATPVAKQRLANAKTSQNTTMRFAAVSPYQRPFTPCTGTQTRTTKSKNPQKPPGPKTCRFLGVH